MEQLKIKKTKGKLLDMTIEDYERWGNNIENEIIDNKYIVYEKIGQGSFGDVYRGMNDETKKEVAIKLLNLSKIESQPNARVKQIRKRLVESEPYLMQQCDSPYLLKCFEVYENQDFKILIIQYCSGKSLQEEIEQKGKIDQKDAIVILKQIINGVAELHKNSIVHRDLKTENIMSHNGKYKIIDFGFSKKLEITANKTEMKNTTLGTITTMAPEVMTRKPYGLKADIWSIGIVFFQMIYGDVPFHSNNAVQMYAEIQKRRFNFDKPLKYNDHTPSEKVTQFFRDVIVIDSEQRLGWKELTQHPMFDGSLTESKLVKLRQNLVQDCALTKPEMEKSLYFQENQNGNAEMIVKQPIKTQQAVKSFQKKVQVKVKQQTSQKIPQKPMLKKESERKQYQRRESPIKQRQPIFAIKETEQKRKGYTKVMRKLQKNQVESKILQIDNREAQEYRWSANIHLECLKTELIYHQLIVPIESYQLIDLTQRENIEMLFLMVTRCYNNMSPIKLKLSDKTRPLEILRKLDDEVSPLYNRVSNKFKLYSELMTKTENKLGSMFTDFFAKRLSKEHFQEKDKYLSGIQYVELGQKGQKSTGSSYLGDYFSFQQVEYTFENYIKPILKTIKLNKKQQKIRNIMTNYRQINQISLEGLKGSTFERVVGILIA